MHTVFSYTAKMIELKEYRIDFILIDDSRELLFKKEEVKMFFQEFSF